MKRQNEETFEQIWRRMMMNNPALASRLNEQEVSANFLSLIASGMQRYIKSISLYKGVLYIDTDSAPAAHEISLHRQYYIDELNRLAGAQVVNAISTRTGRGWG